MVKMAGKDLRSRCMEEGNTKLLSEWDAERNKGLMPENVSAGSHQKVWWQCEKGIHRTQQFGEESFISERRPHLERAC